MNNNDVITLDIDREVLEYMLGHLADAVSKMNHAQAMLRSVVCIIRSAMQEDDHSENAARASAINKDINFPFDWVPNIKRHEESKNGPESSQSEDPSDEGPDEDKMGALVVELLKAVFSVLSDLVENEE